jgi:hypothetical protein
MNHKTAVYIGAGHDISPLLALRDVTHFIYVDSKPTHTNGSVILENYKFSDYEWITDLIQTMKHFNFDLTYSVYSHVPCISFENKQTLQTVNYFIDVIFPHMVHNALLLEITQADVLIVIGHSPHKQVLEYIQTPTLEFVGSNNTYYGQEDGEENSIMNMDFASRVTKWRYIHDSQVLESVRDETNMRKQKDKC